MLGLFFLLDLLFDFLLQLFAADEDNVPDDLDEEPLVILDLLLQLSVLLAEDLGQLHSLLVDELGDLALRVPQPVLVLPELLGALEVPEQLLVPVHEHGDRLLVGPGEGRRLGAHALEVLVLREALAEPVLDGRGDLLVPLQLLEDADHSVLELLELVLGADDEAVQQHVDVDPDLLLLVLAEGVVQHLVHQAVPGVHLDILQAQTLLHTAYRLRVLIVQELHGFVGDLVEHFFERVNVNVVLVILGLKQ